MTPPPATLEAPPHQATKTPGKRGRPKGAGSAIARNERGLTKQQQAFAELVAQGHTAYSAYTAAGYKANTREIAASAATALCAKSHIASEIQRLRAEAAQKNEASRQVKLDILLSLATDKKAFPRDRIAAIAAHNAMTGHNAPTRVEIDTGPNLTSLLQAGLGRVSQVSPLVMRNVTPGRLPTMAPQIPFRPVVDAEEGEDDAENDPENDTMGRSSTFEDLEPF